VPSVASISHNTHALNQVANDHQLLDTTRDYFHFVTAFSEPINTSATHIYHSALELSPLSSIVRKFYYHQRPHPSPRVVIGIPDSWESKSFISATHSNYLSSTWSPSGQSIAATTAGDVRLLDALSLKPLSTLQSAEATIRLRKGLAFSPDGYSLAGCSDTGVIIWDTQTGGVVKEIECDVPGHSGMKLVWALDGRTIGMTPSETLGSYTMHVYNIVVGSILSSVTFQSECQPCIWAYGKSFQIATTASQHGKDYTINIFEAGSTLVKLNSFPLRSHWRPAEFSPSTHRISVSIPESHHHKPELLILDLHNPGIFLLKKIGSYQGSTFSPDASFFGASNGGHFSIWRYTPGNYTYWRVLQQPGLDPQFSPTSSSILCNDHTYLSVMHSDYSPATFTNESVTPTSSWPRDAYSPHGDYIVTTHRGQSIITIINLHSENPSPSQFIDTNLDIAEIVLTGNVLLVKDSDTISAWLLTEEGAVNGVLGNRRADQSDRLWSISLKDLIPQDIPSQNTNLSFWARLLQWEHGEEQWNDHYLGFSVGGEVAALGCSIGYKFFMYHVETGEILKMDIALLHPNPAWHHFYNPHQDECDLYHQNLYKRHECGWPISQNSLHEGWIKDTDGKYRLWLPVCWRLATGGVNWFNKTTTLRLNMKHERYIIKF
jgi:hypothetical protein